MIGLLNTYHIDPKDKTYQKEYGEMFEKYLANLFPSQEIKTYLVAQGKFPDDINECDQWIISGSPASVYDKDKWIQKLSLFIQECNIRKMKILGVCFGHQMIAHALGGIVENSNKGWGVGIREFDIISRMPWMNDELKECSLLFSHQDQVVKLPSGAKLLGSESFCPNQMYSIGSHVFSIQGHPEFTKDFAKGRYDKRVEAIGQGVYDVAIKSLTRDVSPEVDLWIKNFFLFE